MDMHKCLDCEQELKHNKAIGGLTIDVSIKGYDKAKQQLRNLESTFDRILEKQERVGKVVNSNDHKLLERIDNDCGRIVRMLQGESTKDMDKISEKYGERIRTIKCDDGVMIGKGIYEPPMGTMTVKLQECYGDVGYLVNIIMDNCIERRVHIGSNVYICGGGTLRELAK